MHEPQSPLDRPRVLAAILLLLAFFAGVAWLVGQLPATPLGHAAAFLLGVLVLPVAASPYEWLVHRYVCHGTVIPFLRRIYVIHQHGHHYAIFPTGLLASLLVVSDLFVRVHDAIHYPHEIPWLQRRGWFRFLDEHHYIHHVDTSVNVNFLLPLADLLFGTMRRTLTGQEVAVHGTLARPRRLRSAPRSRHAWSPAHGRGLRRERRAPRLRDGWRVTEAAWDRVSPVPGA